MIRYYLFYSDYSIDSFIGDLVSKSKERGFNFVCFENGSGFNLDLLNDNKDLFLFLFEKMIKVDDKNMLFLSSNDVAVVRNGICYMFYDTGMFDIFKNFSLYSLEYFFEKLEELRKDVFSIRNRDWYLIRYGSDSSVYYYVSFSGMKKIHSLEGFKNEAGKGDIDFLFYWKEFVWIFVLPFLKTVFREV